MNLKVSAIHKLKLIQIKTAVLKAKWFLLVILFVR